MRPILAALALFLILAACSSEYIISTRDGGMITTAGKPRVDDRTGMYRYEDAEGREGMIKKDQVVSIIER
jgi:hypothetical protein